MWGGTRLSETPGTRLAVYLCDQHNAHDRNITVWCIGSRVVAHKEKICQTHINVPSPSGDLDYEIETSHIGGTSPNGLGAMTTTVCSAYQADTITLF